MAQFSVNAQRFDPYKNFKFRVKWDGRYVAGISKVGALKRTTEAVEHREGGDPGVLEFWLLVYAAWSATQYARGSGGGCLAQACQRLIQ